MTDDLIKRLHHYANGECDMTPVCSKLLEAADRIEQLESRLDRAVTALDYYAKGLRSAGLARATLAELKEKE